MDMVADLGSRSRHFNTSLLRKSHERCYRRITGVSDRRINYSAVLLLEPKPTRQRIGENMNNVLWTIALVLGIIVLAIILVGML